MTPDITPSSLTTRRGEALVAVLLDEDGQEVVRYFAGDVPVAADQPDAVIEDAIGLAGAWSDLDWPETAEALDRIRHASPPTPPIGP